MQAWDQSHLRSQRGGGVGFRRVSHRAAKRFRASAGALRRFGCDVSKRFRQGRKVLKRLGRCAVRCLLGVAKRLFGVARYQRIRDRIRRALRQPV